VSRDKENDAVRKCTARDEGADGGQIRNLIAQNRAMSQPKSLSECLRADYIGRPDEIVITQNGVLGKSWATNPYVY
jgi:hypothetical protein